MASNNCLVSIGMPVYNGEKYIRQSLDSLLAQDYGHFELIISDNASSDRTQEICLEYADRDKRIRYYRNERNVGMAWNANRVFELASGDYFKWASSYDYVAPSFISACKSILDAQRDVVLAYAFARLIDEEGKTIREIVPEIIDTRRLSTYARLVVVVAKIEHCGVEIYGSLFRSSALRRTRLLLTTFGNDHILMLEISLLGAIALAPEVLWVRRDLRPPSTDHQRIITAMIRTTPDARKRKKARPFWEMGAQHLAAVWRLAPITKTFYWLPIVAYTYYSRWQGQLKWELRHPYSLQEHEVPDY
jgi:glycosyltransferase involved in cell wall biosynthesis